MADERTYTTNYNLVKPGQNDFYNVDDFNENADKIDAAMNQHKTASTLDHPDNSCTDAKIGNRTITDTTVANVSAGTLTNLLSKLGYMIKAITGKANWYTAPKISLEKALNREGDILTGILTSAGEAAPFVFKQAGRKSWLFGRTAGIDELLLVPTTSADGTDWDWTKQVRFYADGRLSLKGALMLPSDPTDGLHAATKQYADTKLTTANPLLSASLYHNRDVAVFATGAQITGTLKILLPVGWTNTNIRLKIEGYDHLPTTGAWFADIAGYNFATTPAWLITRAMLSPNCPFSSVRFAYDSVAGKCCILLGITSTVWTSPRIVISALLGNGSVASFSTNWVITSITDESNITTITPATVKTIATLEAPTFTGSVTLPGDPVSALQAATKQYADTKIPVATINISNGDWNTIKTTGFYAGGAMANSPSTNAGGHYYFVNVIRFSDNYVYQQASGFSGAPTFSYERTCQNGTWTPWKQIATTDTAGLPIGHTFPNLSNTPPAGCLALQGGLVNRDTYPDLWAWVQANAPLITESAWQALAAVQTSVGAYSSGDGSTTFRLPLMMDYVRGGIAADTGKWSKDAFQGHGHKVYHANSGTNISTANAIPDGGNSVVYNTPPSRVGAVTDLYAEEEVDNGYGTPRIDVETRPKTVVMPWYVKAFGATANQGVIDVTALANSIAGKLNVTDIGTLLFGTRVWTSPEYTPVLGTPTISVHNLALDSLKARGEVLLKCTTAEYGYSVGDYAINPCFVQQSNGDTPIVAALATNEIRVTTGAIGTGLAVTRKDNNLIAQVTLANWRIVFRVWY